jgi:hypothetical protein
MMMLRKYLPVVVLLATALHGAAATAPLVAKLDLDRDKMVPGLGVGMRITLINSSNADVEIPGGVIVEVTPAGAAHPFIAMWWGTEYGKTVGGIPQPYHDSVTLKRGNRQTFQFPVGGDNFATAFNDQRLQNPGTYSIRVGLSEQALSVGSWPDDIRSLSDIQRTVDDLLITNVVTLRVVPLQGDDSVVWQMIAKQSGGRGLFEADQRSVQALVQTIWTQHPSSVYAPYAGLMYTPPSDDERKKIVDRVKKLDPHNPLFDWGPINEAMSDERTSGQANQDRKVDRAIEFNERAREEYRAIVESPANDISKIWAQEHLAAMPTVAQLRDADRWHKQVDSRPPAVQQPVLPTVTCTRSKKDRLTVWYGYSSPNTFTVFAPVGPKNHFTPPPDDRGQLTQFEPGDHPHAFKIRVPKDTQLTWTLDGATIPVTPRTPQCTDNDD